MHPPIYFDNNATTPLDPQVKAIMDPWLGQPTNPSSTHGWGRAAREAVEKAREEVAKLVGGQAGEIYFFSSGTEANAAVIRSVGIEFDHRGEVIYSDLEHPSVVEAMLRLERRGMRAQRLPEAEPGLMRAEDFHPELSTQTRLVALMLAHNVTGARQPVAEVTEAAHGHGALVLCDAVQAVGKIGVSVGDLGVDYLTLGAHKFHGPLGAAALWKAKEAPLSPWLAGGGQERGIRASTENVPAIVGLGEAARLARQEGSSRRSHLLELQDRFEAGVRGLPDLRIRALGVPRLPSTSFVEVVTGLADRWKEALDRQGVATSTGPACHDGQLESAGLRFSFGCQNTEEEVDRVLEILGTLAR